MDKVEKGKIDKNKVEGGEDAKSVGAGYRRIIQTPLDTKSFLYQTLMHTTLCFPRTHMPSRLVQCGICRKVTGHRSDFTYEVR